MRGHASDRASGSEAPFGEPRKMPRKMAMRSFRVLNMADTSECDDVLDPLRRMGEVVVCPPDAAILRQRLGEFDAYLASLHVRLDGDTIRGADRLKVIAIPSTGLDHIDL